MNAVLWMFVPFFVVIGIALAAVGYLFVDYAIGGEAPPQDFMTTKEYYEAAKNAPAEERDEWGGVDDCVIL